jgi:hypothetical protein
MGLKKAAVPFKELMPNLIKKGPPKKHILLNTSNPYDFRSDLVTTLFGCRKGRI